MSEFQELIERSAVARREGMATNHTGRAARPSQRRCERSQLDGGRWTPGIRSAISVRESSGSDAVGFVGLASAYESPYVMYDFFGPYTEVVSAGAGAASLNKADLQTPLVIQHDQSRRIAATWITDGVGRLSLSESDAGLEVDAPELDQTDADVRAILPKLRSGLINEMSFAFRIDAGQWSPDYSEFRINQYDIDRGDVAIVGFGANPATTADIRAQRSTDAAKRAIEATRRRMLIDLELSR